MVVMNILPVRKGKALLRKTRRTIGRRPVGSNRALIGGASATQCTNDPRISRYDPSRRDVPQCS